MVASVDGGCGSSDRGIPWRAWEGEVGRGPAVDGARRRKKRPVATACPWPERDAGRAHGRWRPARAGVRPDRRGKPPATGKRGAGGRGSEAGAQTRAGGERVRAGAKHGHGTTRSRRALVRGGSGCRQRAGLGGERACVRADGADDGGEREEVGASL